MTLSDVFALVDRDTTGYRAGNDYHLPAGKLRSIVEVAYLAGQAEHRREVTNAKPISKTQRGPYAPRYAESA